MWSFRQRERSLFAHSPIRNPALLRQRKELHHESRMIPARDAWCQERLPYLLPDFPMLLARSDLIVNREGAMFCRPMLRSKDTARLPKKLRRISFSSVDLISKLY